MKTLETMLGVINPDALPALRIAGALFLIINLLAGSYAVRHWRRLFGPDSRVDGDSGAVRQLQVMVILIPWLSLTTRLGIEWVKLWIA